MDYKEKYEQALKRAKELLEGMDKGDYFASNRDIENIFPELQKQECEDERIRKEIIDFLELPHPQFVGKRDHEKWITWLEKQGEKKPTNEIEPKFKVGDWIVFNGLILHIDEIVNGYYRTTSIGDGIHNSYDWDIDNAARLWTIEDAKNGDVLIRETGEPFIYNGNRGSYIPEFLGAYCGISDGRFRSNGSPYYWGRPTCPATKEQCDMLFQKIKEAGYEWDAENKKLKTIEPKPLNADKVIEWLDKQACLGWLEDVEVEKVVEQFKKDFGL